MPHIHTNPGQHDTTVSAFIIYLSNDVPKLIMHEHKKHNFWLPFGGHVELDESPWKAILHEIKEESGYLPQQLKILQPEIRIKSLNHAELNPMPFLLNTHKINENHFHSDICFAFTTYEEPALDLLENESHIIDKISRNDLNNKKYDFGNDDTVKVVEFVLGEIIDNWRQIELSEFPLG